MGKPKRQDLPDFGALSIPEVALLLTGRGRGNRWSPGSSHKDPEAAWAAHGEALTAFWTDRHRRGQKYKLPITGGPRICVPGPGHRPWAWWNFTARHPRQILLEDGTGKSLFKTNFGRGLKLDWDQSRGRFSFGIPSSHPPGIQFESERQYLARLNLLLPEEKSIH